MFTWANISALIQALPAILRLFQSFVNYAERAEGRKLGRAEAYTEAAQLAADQIEAASIARAEADKDHVAHPDDDSGFDKDFKRD